MAKVKIVLNKEGVKQLLRSQEAGAICMEHANRIRESAGQDYAAEARHYPERTGAAVFPANADGYFDNMKNNTLLRSMK